MLRDTTTPPMSRCAARYVDAGVPTCRYMASVRSEDQPFVSGVEPSPTAPLAGRERPPPTAGCWTPLGTRTVPESRQVGFDASASDRCQRLIRLNGPLTAKLMPGVWMWKYSVLRSGEKQHPVNSEVLIRLRAKG